LVNALPTIEKCGQSEVYLPDSNQDIWSKWILQRQFGGDSERMKAVLIVETKQGKEKSALEYLWAIKRSPTLST
jgi:hypothetical protein